MKTKLDPRPESLEKYPPSCHGLHWPIIFHRKRNDNTPLCWYLLANKSPRWMRNLLSGLNLVRFQNRINSHTEHIYWENVYHIALTFWNFTKRKIWELKHLSRHPYYVQRGFVYWCQTETPVGLPLHVKGKIPHCHPRNHLHQIYPFQPAISEKKSVWTSQIQDKRLIENS